MSADEAEAAFDEAARRLTTMELCYQEITVDLTPEQVGMVETWIASQPEPKPTMTEAIRHLILLGAEDGTAA